MRKLILVALCFLMVRMTQGIQNISPAEGQTEELLDYLEGLAQLDFNWNPLNSPVDPISAQLIEFSGEGYRIVPGQKVEWGQAHFGGVIILAGSAIEMPRDFLAYRLAHEWGHQALGHPPNLHRLPGEMWKFRFSPAREEDEADAYAGRFLAQYNYSLEQVTRYLGTLPDHFLQRDGTIRAQTISRAYSQYLRDEGNGPGKESVSITGECTHPLHPDGHLVACEHLLHVAGHRINCRHSCFWGGRFARSGACHPEGDQVPCEHPVHEAGDVVPCTHPAHPEGHGNKE